MGYSINLLIQLPLLQLLLSCKFEIPPFPINQFFVRPLLHDPPTLHQINHICLLDSTEPMCDSERSSSFYSGRSIHCRLDEMFRFRVECGSCFIKEEDFGVADESASDSYTLFLSS